MERAIAIATNAGNSAMENAIQPNVVPVAEAVEKFKSQERRTVTCSGFTQNICGYDVATIRPQRTIGVGGCFLRLIKYNAKKEMKNRKNKKLAQDILAMVHKDQRMRKSGKWDASVDKRNTKRLKEIIRKYGWPTFSLVGKAGTDGAWLLAQHADLDVKFQKRILALMENAVVRKEADKKHLAYLTDRVLVNTRQPQLYGTQFFMNKNGVLGPRPITDVTRLAIRRKEFGLELFSLYTKRMQQINRKFFRSNKKRAS